MEAAGMTAADVARESGELPSTLTRLLDGTTGSPRLDKIVVIAEAVDVRPEWLAFGTGPRKDGFGNDEEVRSLRARVAELEEQLEDRPAMTETGRLRARVAELERALREVERHVEAAVGAALGRR